MTRRVYVMSDWATGLSRMPGMADSSSVGYRTTSTMRLQKVCVTTSSTFERHQKTKLKRARKQKMGGTLKRETSRKTGTAAAVGVYEWKTSISCAHMQGVGYIYIYIYI